MNYAFLAALPLVVAHLGVQAAPKTPSGPAAAASAYAKGLLQQKMGRAKAAFNDFALAARIGDIPAEVRLGRDYASGRGVRRSYAKALLWYRTAASAGNPSAMVYLGGLYRRGRGVRKSPEAAARWYVEAVIHGAGPVGKLLGRVGAMCVRAKIGKTDKAGLLRMLRAAAVGGNANAMLGLAEAYNAGILVSQSRPGARRWFHRAADAGSVPAMFYLASVRYFDQYAPRLSPSRAKRDEARAFYWWHRAALAGNAMAMYFVGSALISGRATGKMDFKPGLAWLREAAARGQPRAMEDIGNMHIYGQLPRSYRRALYWYRKAAAAGAKKSAASDIKALNTMYRYGIFTKH